MTPENSRSLHSATPDFLSSVVALANFKRLSLRKAAQAAMSSAAWQEIPTGAKRSGGTCCSTPPASDLTALLTAVVARRPRFRSRPPFSR